MTLGEQEQVAWAPRGQSASNRAVRREERRRTEAMQAMRIGDTEAEAIAMQAGSVNVVAPPSEREESPQEIQKRIRETDRRKDEALQTFKRTLLDREVDAYLKGADTAIDREAKRAYNIRSIVLLLVVLAVVLMPVVAIIAGLSTQDFGSYIAPITAIAGTVVGHWFGERGRTTTTGD
jgi:hypothetical protein